MRQPKSNYAAVGLYFYDAQAPALAAQLKPSARGELEITDLNRAYLRQGQLYVQLLGRGIAWLDTGTPDAMLQAGNFVQTVQQRVQQRQGLMICCPEEIAYRQGWIDEEQVLALAAGLNKNHYGQYLLRLVGGPQE